MTDDELSQQLQRLRQRTDALEPPAHLLESFHGSSSTRRSIVMHVEALAPTALMLAAAMVALIWALAAFDADALRAAAPVAAWSEAGE